MGKIVIILFTR